MAPLKSDRSEALWRCSHHPVQMAFLLWSGHGVGRDYCGASSTIGDGNPLRHRSVYDKRLLPYAYAATTFFVRLVAEIDLPGNTVSVHPAGAELRYASSAVIAGIPNFVPIALHDNPSRSRSRTTSSRRKDSFRVPDVLPDSLSFTDAGERASRIVSLFCASGVRSIGTARKTP